MSTYIRFKYELLLCTFSYPSEGLAGVPRKVVFNIHITSFNDSPDFYGGSPPALLFYCALAPTLLQSILPYHKLPCPALLTGNPTEVGRARKQGPYSSIPQHRRMGGVAPLPQRDPSKWVVSSFETPTWSFWDSDLILLITKSTSKCLPVMCREQTEMSSPLSLWATPHVGQSRNLSHDASSIVGYSCKGASRIVR